MGTVEYSTCNAVTGERQEVGVFKPGKVLEQGNGVAVINVPGVVEDLDGHVELSGKYGSVDRPTPALRQLGLLAEV